MEQALHGSAQDMMGREGVLICIGNSCQRHAKRHKHDDLLRRCGHLAGHLDHGMLHSHHPPFTTARWLCCFAPPNPPHLYTRCARVPCSAAAILSHSCDTSPCTRRTWLLTAPDRPAVGEGSRGALRQGTTGR